MENERRFSHVEAIECTVAGEELDLWMVASDAWDILYAAAIYLENSYGTLIEMTALELLLERRVLLTEIMDFISKAKLGRVRAQIVALTRSTA